MQRYAYQPTAATRARGKARATERAHRAAVHVPADSSAVDERKRGHAAQLFACQPTAAPWTRERECTPRSCSRASRRQRCGPKKGRAHRAAVRIPAHRGLVVVRAGVHKAVGVVVVRQVRVVGAAAPRELQHDHAGCPDRAPQRLDVFSDHAEVFSHDERRRVAEVGGHGVKEGFSRALAPVAHHGGLLLGADAPVAGERAEVVDARLVVHLKTPGISGSVGAAADGIAGEDTGTHDTTRHEQQQGQAQRRRRGAHLAGAADAAGPPGEVLLSMRIPAVEGRAPELAGLAERVRRHAAHL